jgi:hypothetical protein
MADHLMSDYERKKAAADQLFRDSKYENFSAGLQLSSQIQVNNSDAPELIEEKTQIQDFQQVRQQRIADQKQERG